nr:MAG TPA: hypothetical protein [Caudoviricetes sp.]
MSNGSILSPSASGVSFFASAKSASFPAVASCTRSRAARVLLLLIFTVLVLPRRDCLFFCFIPLTSRLLANRIFVLFIAFCVTLL